MDTITSNAFVLICFDVRTVQAYYTGMPVFQNIESNFVVVVDIGFYYTFLSGYQDAWRHTSYNLFVGS